MSAAKWRRVMSQGAAAYPAAGLSPMATPSHVSAAARSHASAATPSHASTAAPALSTAMAGATPTSGSAGRETAWLAGEPRGMLRPLRQARAGISRPAIVHACIALALLLYPAVATPFFTFQVGAQSLVLGLVALSLALLAGYGGMVTLSQMTVAGIAGYSVALLGVNANAAHSLGWPWWLAVLAALAIGTLAATLIGMLAVRTEGIYTIMITLAIGVAFFYLVQQNYSVFNGFQGLARVLPPMLYGADLRAPVPFYYISLACAALGYAAVAYIARAPFGIALQGIRDNARRMSAACCSFGTTRRFLPARSIRPR